jgi:site-specific recombinase XerD
MAHSLPQTTAGNLADLVVILARSPAKRTYSLPLRQGATVPGRVVPLTTTARLLGEAAKAFLAQPDLAASTRHSYQQTLDRLERDLGADQPLATLTVDQVTATVTVAWAGRSPATWNRHVATVRSFLKFCRRRRWLVDDDTEGSARLLPRLIAGRTRGPLFMADRRPAPLGLRPRLTAALTPAGLG